MSGNEAFDLFRTTEEHDLLRETVRALCEEKIAPFAAEVDEQGRFPQEALDALNATGLSAVHVGEELNDTLGIRQVTAECRRRAAQIDDALTCFCQCIRIAADQRDRYTRCGQAGRNAETEAFAAAENECGSLHAGHRT